MTKRVIISGGGTGGHIFPALSIANALKRIEPEMEILFVGAEGRMEMERVPEAGYKIEGLPVKGFRRSLSPYNFVVLYDLLRSLIKARKIVKQFNPDAVVGVGGYASGPVGRVASRMGIPLILQEQNSYPGVTNKLLAERALKICVAYDGMERFFESAKIVKTGNPVRKELLDALSARDEGIAYYELDPTKRIVLVTGGSLGAATINEAIGRNLKEIAGWSDVQILWQCGGYYYAGLKEELAQVLPENVKLTPFLKRMDLAYAVADIVVARAGASTISELSLLGKAAILIPSPNVAEDHQTKNARALTDRGAAHMVADCDAVEKLCPLLREMLSDDKARVALSKKIKEFGVIGSDEIIAKVVLSYIK